MACLDRLDAEKVALVFQARPDIIEGIQAATDTPERASLFNNIAAFVLDRLSDASDSHEPALKRRRLDAGGSHSNGTVPINDATATNGAATKASATGGDSAASADAAAQEELQLEIKDISLSVPQRKKLNLCFTKNYLYARTNADPAPVAGVVYRWADIEHAFYVPVPEKAQQQWNYVLFPRGSYLPSSAPAAGTTSPEPLVFTVPATAPKAGTVGGRLAGQAQAVSDSHSTLFHWAIAEFLRIAHKYHAPSPETTGPVPLVSADAKVFHSAVRQSHRPSEKAVHVRAFRGSKDGYLFFLPTGILWGFKKPLLFLPLDRITAFSYTSVLQRTFNVVVEVDLGDGATEELEFSMLDQEDYGGINENYIMKHHLQDRSMAEQRKAKRELAENAKKGGAAAAAQGGDGEAGGDGAEEDDGLTELERAEKEAEQQLQDEEDEDEEDYDPGSDGDSEGEGTSSEEEDEDGNGGEDEEESDGDS